MDPVHATPVPAEYILEPGDLVTVLVPGSPPAEVHNVEIDDHEVRYLVRMLADGWPDHPLGSFVTLPHDQVHQSGLSTPPTWDGILHDPRVVKYLDADDRRNLGTLSTAHVGTEPSIDGVLAVTADTFRHIVENRSKGHPPLRPDLGTRGQVTWMVIKGDPVVGAPRSGQVRDQEVKVRVFPTVSVDQLVHVTTADLTHRVEQSLRTRWADLANVAAGFVEANLGKKIPGLGEVGRDELEGMVRQAVAFALANQPLLTTVVPGRSTDELVADNRAIEAKVRADLAANRLVARFCGFVTFAGAVQAAMWEELGRHVETLPGQAAVVDFTGSPLSRRHDGQYLLVARRGFIYLVDPR